MPIPRLHAESRQGPCDRLILLASLAILGLACQAENRGEVAVGTPAASFSQDQTSGTPGTVIQFSDTSAGDITSYSWDFGPLGSRSERHPLVTFPDVGSYSVELTVSGPRGSSRVMKPALIDIGEIPVAGSSCFPTQGFAPLTVSCTDRSTGAASISWDFGGGTTSEESSVEHVFAAGGSYPVELTASSGGGVDTATIMIEVYPFDIVASPRSGSGSAPLDVTFTAITGGLSGMIAWVVDGEIQSGGTILQHRFRQPGTFFVSLIFVDRITGIGGERMIEYVVDYGPASAAFRPSVSGGSGPLDVTLIDESGGAIDTWEWSFGDGTQCVYPEPAVPDPFDPLPTCDASSPSHTYEAVGFYDVSLTVTGPAADANDPELVSSTTTIDAVRVYIKDASFEQQIADAPIEAPWTHLRPDDALAMAEHVALSDADQPDGGMPTDGEQWAVLDGEGTDGLTPVDAIENGIRQDFFRPADQVVLEFDYALLYSERPGSVVVLDAFTATVSDGTTTVEIPSARADDSSPYAGPSSLFPTDGGRDVRITPVHTASINLATAFPAATDRTPLTLTIRVSNAGNELRSPRAYVDNIRFTEPENVLFAQFVLDSDPVVAGEDVVFTDKSCLNLDPDLAPPPPRICPEPTSFRWDFDTQNLFPSPSASGSGEQSPSYAFPEAREYDVRMLARLADLDSEFSMTVTVIEGATAAFELLTSPPLLAGQPLSFNDLSTADPNDPIVDWSWDFDSWGISSLQNPDSVVIGQPGDWIIRLKVTTASGLTDITDATVTVE